MKVGGYRRAVIHLGNHLQANRILRAVSTVLIVILLATVQPNGKDGTEFGSGGTGEPEMSTNVVDIDQYDPIVRQPVVRQILPPFLMAA
mmetsp:Transcript_1336/g.1367  ORF Transcript_1336/g.1367 Transcript_1336/m.1367 type:complete len:89 (-) Transcript_1336:107-373(-)